MSEQLSRNPADIEAERAADDAAYDGKWHDFVGIEVGDSEKLDDVIADVHFRREEEATQAHYRALEELDKQAEAADEELAEGAGEPVESEYSDDHAAEYENYDEENEDPLAGDVDKWVPQDPAPSPLDHGARVDEQRYGRI